MKRQRIIASISKSMKHPIQNLNRFYNQIFSFMLRGVTLLSITYAVAETEPLLRNCSCGTYIFICAISSVKCLHFWALSNLCHWHWFVNYGRGNILQKRSCEAFCSCDCLWKKKEKKTTTKANNPIHSGQRGLFFPVHAHGKIECAEMAQLATFSKVCQSYEILLWGMSKLKTLRQSDIFKLCVYRCWFCE